MSRKKPLLEQKSSLRKLQQTPRSQPSSDQTATPSALRVTRTPGSGISVTSPDKSFALDDVDNVKFKEFQMFFLFAFSTTSVSNV